MFGTRRSALVALAVTALAAPVLTLAACGGSGESSGTSMAAPQAGSGEAGSGAASASVAGGLAPADAKQAAAAPGQAAPGQAAAGQAGTAAGQGAAVVQARVVRTAEVVVEVQQLATSAARVRAAALGLGGVVASEVTTFAATGQPGSLAAGSGATGARPDLSSADRAVPDTSVAGTRVATPGESVIVLRVPVSSLDSAVDKVAAIGRELSRSTASQDVTADLADLGSRVKTQQASVDRVRVLLAKATSMQDIVLLESQLSTREADLEALQARQASLADRADLSTLTVTLRTPEVVATQPAKDDGGFMSGLKSGWHAVAVSTTVVLTLLGAVLPVLVAAAVIGWPVYLLIRRRTRARAASAGNPSAGNPSAGNPFAGAAAPAAPAASAAPAAPAAPPQP
jgi:hypothetical protein